MVEVSDWSGGWAKMLQIAACLIGYPKRLHHLRRIGGLRNPYVCTSYGVGTALYERYVHGCSRELVGSKLITEQKKKCVGMVTRKRRLD